MEVKKTNKPKHVYGKPVYKPTISTIFICGCGNKYLKTREGQVVCLRCLLPR